MKLLKARNKKTSGTAVWHRRDGAWVCTSGDFTWMIGMDPESAKQRLTSLGLEWTWSDKPTEPPLTIRQRMEAQIEADPITIRDRATAREKGWS